MDLLPQLRGAFCFVFMDEHTLYAARDPQGIRPLVLGRLERGWVVASETAALDIVGASLVREIEPGELIAIDEDGLRSTRSPRPSRKGCVFEYVYLARPDTTINGRVVHEARVEMGRTLAREHPVEADLVIADPGVRHARPRSATRRSPASPTAQGLVKNSYVGRTFIAPSRRSASSASGSSSTRCEVVEGKRLVVVDDSIVRGNTQRALVRMLREAGRRRGPRPDLLAAGEVAVLLRHRLRHPGRADRHRRSPSTRSRTRSAPTPSATSPLEGMIAATEQPATGSARPASPAATRSSCPTRAGWASTSSRRCHRRRRGRRLARCRRRRRGRPHPPLASPHLTHLPVRLNAPVITGAFTSNRVPVDNPGAVGVDSARSGDASTPRGTSSSSDAGGTEPTTV